MKIMLTLLLLAVVVVSVESRSLDDYCEQVNHDKSSTFFNVGGFGVINYVKGNDTTLSVVGKCKKVSGVGKLVFNHCRFGSRYSQYFTKEGELPKFSAKVAHNKTNTARLMSDAKTLVLVTAECVNGKTMKQISRTYKITDANKEGLAEVIKGKAKKWRDLSRKTELVNKLKTEAITKCDIIEMNDGKFKSRIIKRNKFNSLCKIGQ